MVQSTQGKTVRNNVRTVRLMPTDMGCIDSKRIIIQTKIEPTDYTSITIHSEHFLTKS